MSKQSSFVPGYYLHAPHLQSAPPSTSSNTRWQHAPASPSACDSDASARTSTAPVASALSPSADTKSHSWKANYIILASLIASRFSSRFTVASGPKDTSSTPLNLPSVLPPTQRSLGPCLAPPSPT